MKSNKVRKVDNNLKNEELQMELKINKIPQHYFADSNQYKLELCRRNELRQRQEEMTEYLDEIEVVLFSKSGKYP